MYAKISSVESVCFSILKSNPPQMVVYAVGTVPSSGWTEGVLSSWIYIDPPADGIQDFDFLAKPPNGPALHVISPIGGQSEPGEAPGWLKGFRVHAATNSKEISLEDKACKVRLLGDGDIWPWPWSKPAPAG